jgi:hypothetical protein
MPRPRPRQDAQPPAFRSGLDAAAVRTLTPEGSLPILQALGLVQSDGRATADTHRKLKQVAHFVRLLEPALQDVFDRHPEPVLVDFGAGRSALGLVLAHAWCQRLDRGRLLAVEARDALMARTRDAARAVELDRFEVHVASILDVALPERVHLALALHACDQATDHALVRAVRARADVVALVPCCQAEVARLLREAPGEGTLNPLWKHAWHRREFGAHLTNVLRALTLQALGYQVTVTELAGWEHAVKNELILARRVGRYHAAARRELLDLCATLGVRPWLLQALEAELQAAGPGSPTLTCSEGAEPDQPTDA